MVLGGICIQVDGRTVLYVVNGGSMTARMYRYHRYEVLHPNVGQFAGPMGQDFILMQDNSHPHTARVAKGHLNQKRINVNYWSPRSPDLNPIEHVCDFMSRRVSHRPNPPRDV